MLNLPYENLDNWGLYGPSFQEERIGDSRVYNITIDKGHKLEYRDDKEYFLESTPLADKYQW